MNNRLKSGIVATLYLLMGCSSLYAVVWDGTSAPGVVDENIEIVSDTTLSAGSTTIEAVNQDLVITVTAPNVHIKENEVGLSQLYLLPAEGRTITVKVNQDLIFLGKESNDTDQLLILQGGKGKVIWEITGGYSLKFDAPINGSGTRYVLYMNPGTDSPEAVFVRDPAESPAQQAEDVYVEAGAHSSFGYVSTLPVGDESEFGSFTFDPSTTSTGLMQFQISNQGGMIISPRQTIVTNAADVTISAITDNILSGGIAQFQVVNTQIGSAHSTLFIANKNETMSDLLYDPFLNLGVRQDNTYYRGTFSGNQYGFILGSNGLFVLGDSTSVHYVGLDINRSIETMQVPEVPGYTGIPIDQLLKQRNASALICDQSLDPLVKHPTVGFGNESALYLRSGVGILGNVHSLNHPHPYTVKPQDFNPDTGYYLLDIEGQADFYGIDGSNGQQAKIELLSLEVNPIGGALLLGGTQTNFASRSFAQLPDGSYYGYNKGAIFVNGYWKINNLSLVHSDSNSVVIPEETETSFPVYVGGETTYLLKEAQIITPGNNARPKIALESSLFWLFTNAAFSGLDLLIPNQVDSSDNAVVNLSKLIFGFNGYTIDQGTGRALILGTTQGSTAADGVTITDNQAHLDIIQIQDAFGSYPVTNNHQLSIEVIPTDGTIIPGVVPSSIQGLCSQHLIYLGHLSNISIGTNADATGFNAVTNPTLNINGNYFVFGTDGGLLNDARSSARTGTGGVFVDLNGTITIGDTYSAFMGAMVTKSRNSVVNLPVENVRFAKQLGITFWKLVFGLGRYRDAERVMPLDEYSGPVVPPVESPSNPILLLTGESVTDLGIDWLSIIKDPNFQPYQGGSNSLPVGRVILPNQPSPVLPETLINIPTIQGDVQQLQISGSRLGDPAHILIDGGYVHELVFVDTSPNPDPGQAPVAVIILTNGGRVGIGSADRNSDSADAAVTLGRNGVIIISDKGENEVILNNSVIINGDTPFIFGPNSESNTAVLTISSEVDDSLIVRKGACLDLRSVVNGKTLKLAGKLSLFMEANTKIICADGNTIAQNGWTPGTLLFSENTQLNFAEYDDFDTLFDSLPAVNIIDNTLLAEPTIAGQPRNQYSPVIGYGLGLQNTDSFRVRIIGQQNIVLQDTASWFIPYKSVVGVETYIDQGPTGDEIIFNNTIINITLNDGSKIYLGNQNYAEGGVLQIGNTSDLGADHTISFTLTVNGNAAEFVTGAKSLLGLNVGVVKGTQTTPSDLLIDNAYNVKEIVLNLNDGAIDLSRIYDTTSGYANIVAIGDNGDNTPKYTFAYGEIGNQVQTIAEIRAQNATVLGGSPLVYLVRNPQFVSAISPVVLNINGQIPIGTDDNGNPVYSDRMQVGMVASTALQNVATNEISVSAMDLFEQLATPEAYDDMSTSHDKANAGSEDEEFRESLESIRLGTVIAGALIRRSIEDIFSGINNYAAGARKEAVDTGAVFADLSKTALAILSAAVIGY